MSHGDLLVLAAKGERAAWDALVDRFAQMVWSVARGFRLDEATAKDVAQTVWLRLIENIDSIEEPERLPGWLATTARREALRVAKRVERDVPSDFEYDVEDRGPSLDEMLIDQEENRFVVTAFKTLDDACRELLRLMTIEPALSYEELSELTGRPIGSLGPTRARCLEKLKGALARITSGGGGSSESGGEH
ncbi:MAG TPA: sigma-70 family RNA polymerase sigma factor [Acidimicrobiia bacterium]|nr:sigma-70 family RNA polymerase sigma factor [Acidimicrobiia bacterium]